MNKLNMQTHNIVDENIKKIAELFPNCLTERLDENGKPEVAIDFDQLRQELSKDIVEGPEERYQFTWPDKRNAIRLANAPTTDTLRPCREESVDFDNTQNLYIEGDNLEVLKLLRENYLGKVKMIYIDPPYNTGNDFVYNDDFAQTAGDYVHNSGQEDEEGNRLVANTESNGRFHTDWLNMIYPRLKVAKDLLSEDGVIFISIDDNEQDNLKKICDEIFGATNYINTIALKTKASAGASGGGEDKRLKKNAEFIHIYTKNRSLIGMEKPVEYKLISEFIQEHKDNNVGFYYTRILEDYGSKELICEKDGIKIFEHHDYKFSTVSEKMKTERMTQDEVYSKYFDQIFMVTNAQTSLLEKVNSVTPAAGMLISYEYKPKTGKDKNKIVSKYVWNKTLVVWFADSAQKKNGNVYKAEQIGTLWDDISWGRLDLQGGVPFKNGKKPLKLLERLIQMATDENSIVLDFFSGSATTADAVLQRNDEDGGNRKFIMVQLPEATDEKSEAYKAGYKNICEIGKERIRRAGKKIVEDQEKKRMEEGLFAGSSTGSESRPLDIGFRVLKLDSSNMQDVYYSPEQFNENLLFEDNIKHDRTDEDLLFQAMIELGIELSAKIEKREIAGKTVWSVAEGYLMACFDKDVNETAITEIARQHPYYFVLRDSSLATDNVADNFEQIWEEYSKETVRRII